MKQSLAPDTPGFRVLCPTRWTVRADSLKSVLDNYRVLQDLWEVAKDESSDPTIRARIIGVESQFKTFHYLFGILLGELLLRHSDNLSKTLQSPNLSASESQQIASMTVATLQSIRNDVHFDLFWQKLECLRLSLDIEEPKLPRRRKLPRRFEEGTADAEYFDDCKAYYRQQYYEALDLITSSIKERFDQPGYKIYQNLQELLLKTIRKEDTTDCFSFVTSFYKNDFNLPQLKLHLDILATNFPDEGRASATIFDIKEYMLSLSVPERSLISEAVTALKLVLVMPGTNALSERSFSALRRIKTYLRSTMTQERLNNLLVLHVHKELTDNLDLIDIGNQFIVHSEHRMSAFGKLLRADIFPGGFCMTCKAKLHCSSCSKN